MQPPTTLPVHTSVEQPPGESALLSIAPELLNLIVEHVCEDEKRAHKSVLLDNPNLKNLRLVHSRFAYVPVILERLFESVRLVASPEHAAVVAKTNLQTLRKYVKHVQFEPSKESWTTTKNNFEDIILYRPFTEVVDALFEEARNQNDGKLYQEVLRMKEEQIKTLGCKGFIKKHLPENSLFTDAEIDTGYNAYMARANATKALFDSGELAKTWGHALGQLDRLEGVKIKAWDFTDHHSVRDNVKTRGKEWKELGVEVYGHAHPTHDGYPHSYEDCQLVQAPVGEALCMAALRSIADGALKIKTLDINYIGSGSFVWADNGQLHDLDLSLLEDLYFNPELGDDDGFDEERVDLAVLSLLAKSATSLKDLHYMRSGGGKWEIAWPAESSNGIDDMPVFSALESFTTSAMLKLETFPIFLREKCPKLSYLELSTCGAIDDDAISWRGVWDAIRDHPQRMRLSFDQVPCNECAELTLYHHTGEEYKEEPDGDVWTDVDISLAKYMSKRGPWDKACRMWFENESESDDNTGGAGSEDEHGWEDD